MENLENLENQVKVFSIDGEVINRLFVIGSSILYDPDSKTIFFISKKFLDSQKETTIPVEVKDFNTINVSDEDKQLLQKMIDDKDEERRQMIDDSGNGNGGGGKAKRKSKSQDTSRPKTQEKGSTKIKKTLIVLFFA